MNWQNEMEYKYVSYVKVFRGECDCLVVGWGKRDWEVKLSARRNRKDYVVSELAKGVEI